MSPRILIWLARRDLRLADNPILHEVSKLNSQSHAPFTHLLPLYVFPAQQIEISGFLKPEQRSPYPEARSEVGKYWRCGHHRVKFIAESVWDLKKSLEGVGSGLEIRVGMLQDVVAQVLDAFKDTGADVAGVWMTSEPGVEEKREERAVQKELERRGKEFKLVSDEKYFIDDRDLPIKNPKELPDVFTSFKKMCEPLREAPRKVLPEVKTLPQLPPNIPQQADPFTIPSSLEVLVKALHKPLSSSLDLKNPPKWPSTSAPTTAIPFSGGEGTAHDRIKHLITSGSMTYYKDTRNGLLGPDFSSKLSAWLALGCCTSRQIHRYLLDFEDARSELGKGAPGYGKGENKGTAAMRFELAWRDYFRLCTRKFGPRLFHAEGFRNDDSVKWKYDNEALTRFLEGSTGMGLIDASQRELFLTGYTSNRARQNVASYLAKHLGLDWRLGAEWYECCLVDYDVCSNWANWQYNAGVGNDPREGGGGRKFNPVKQASDYDGKAEYVMGWCEELRGLEPEEAWQVWKVSQDRKEHFGLDGRLEVQKPLVRIEWSKRGGRGGGKGGGGGYQGPGRGGDRNSRGKDRGRGGKNRGNGRSGFSKREDA